MSRHDARQAALDALAAGLSVLPPKEDGSKAPSGQWIQYQHERATIETIHLWYGTDETPRRSGCGLICGAISGNLECFEFDAGGRLYEHYKATARSMGYGSLIDKLETGYLERSPSGGYHWLYRCSVISGNTKLAVAADHQSLIETRGEGGYIIVAPSNGKVHRTGGAYVLLAGSFNTIPVITPEERLTLWDVARIFNEEPDETTDPWVMKVDSIGNTSPWDEYNKRTNWRDLLIGHGWTHVFTKNDVQYWRRPGKDHSHSATVNHGGTDRLKCFSSSAEFSIQGTYSRFGAYAVWEHGGDWKAAIKALKKETAQEKAKPKPPPEGTPLVIRLDTIEPKEIDWLWKERIPKGFITIFFGTTGVGKSFVALDIAARLTRGDAWPDSRGECCNAGNVLIISEDPFEYVLTPRLIELGAVMSKIYAMTWEAMQSWIIDDVVTLGKAFAQSDNPALIIIDPPTNFLGDIDEHKNSKVRAALMQLVIWLNSQASPVACVLITHCKKPTSESLESIYQMIGSVAWGSTARIGHALITDPDDRTRRLFVCSKSNLGEIPKGYAYRIIRAGKNAKVEWIVEVDVNADEVMSGESSKSIAIEAAEWLVDRFLERRAWPSKELEQLALRDGFTINAIFKNPIISNLIKEGKIKRKQHYTAPRKFFHEWIAQPGWPPAKNFQSENWPESAESAESVHVNPYGIKENHTFGSSVERPESVPGPESVRINTLSVNSTLSDSVTDDPKVCNVLNTNNLEHTFGTFGTFGCDREREKKADQTAFAIKFLIDSLRYGELSRSILEDGATEKQIPQESLINAAERLEIEKIWVDGREVWKLNRSGR